MRLPTTLRLSSIPILLLTTIFASSPMRGQCNQIPNFISAPVNSDSTLDLAEETNTDEIFASYGFEKEYDSTYSLYRISDITLNGERVMLSTWCAGKNISGISNSILSDSSTTESFVVSTDDTIFFYREFSWATVTDSGKWIDENFYKSLDTLDYSIELVDSSSGDRLALLDSVGVLRNTAGSTPNIYGSRPILATVSYIVPSSQNGKTVYLKVNVHSRGSSGTGFSRTDRWGIGLQRRLTYPMWQYIANYVDTVTVKAAVQLARNPDKTLLQANATDGGHIDIRYTPSDAASTSVIVFNSEGRRMFVPVMLPSPSYSTPNNAIYLPPASGVYYVALLYEGQIIMVDKVSITR